MSSTSDDLITVTGGGFRLTNTGSISVVMPAAGTGYGNTTLTSVTYGSGGGGGGSYNVTYPTASGTYTAASTGWSAGKITAEADITISRPGKPDIKVAETISAIMETLCIIIPDEDLMSRYPALRDAYDEHQKKWLESMSSNGVREAYDSYRTIKALVTSEKEDE